MSRQCPRQCATSVQSVSAVSQCVVGTEPLCSPCAVTIQAPTVRAQSLCRHLQSVCSHCTGTYSLCAVTVQPVHGHFAVGTQSPTVTVQSVHSQCTVSAQLVYSQCTVSVQSVYSQCTTTVTVQSSVHSVYTQYTAVAGMCSPYAGLSTFLCT